MKLGYKIVKIYEIWHYPLREKYNKSDKTGGFFTEYVNTFLRIKQESSDYPHWVETEADKGNILMTFFKMKESSYKRKTLGRIQA